MDKRSTSVASNLYRLQEDMTDSLIKAQSISQNLNRQNLSSLKGKEREVNSIYQK